MLANQKIYEKHPDAFQTENLIKWDDQHKYNKSHIFPWLARHAKQKNHFLPPLVTMARSWNVRHMKLIYHLLFISISTLQIKNITTADFGFQETVIFIQSESLLLLWALCYILFNKIKSGPTIFPGNSTQHQQSNSELFKIHVYLKKSDFQR